MKQVSVSEYAKLKGVTRQAVLGKIKRKTLPRNVTAIKVGKQFILTVDETK